MSQPAGTERPPPPRGAAGGGGNLLTRRYGGVPAWGWVAIVSLVAGGVIWYVRRKRAASSAQSATGAAGPTQATCYDANGATVACSDPSAVGSNATDYFEALYAQNEGINNQLQNQQAQLNETGIDVDTLEKLIRELQGEESRDDGGKIPGEPPPLRHQVKIPDVAGKRAQAAVEQLRAAGFQAHTDPLRKSINEYDATGTTPEAGLERPRGSTVIVHVKEIRRGRRPAGASSGGNTPGSRGTLPPRPTE